MAICKHNVSKNGFAAPLEYLTMQHDKNGRLLLDGEGEVDGDVGLSAAVMAAEDG